MTAEIQREGAGGGAESGTEADEGKARKELNKCAVKGGEVEREHRRAREQEKGGGRADDGGSGGPQRAGDAGAGGCP